MVALLVVCLSSPALGDLGELRLGSDRSGPGRHRGVPLAPRSRGGGRVAALLPPPPPPVRDVVVVLAVAFALARRRGRGRRGGQPRGDRGRGRRVRGHVQLLLPGHDAPLP